LRGEVQGPSGISTQAAKKAVSEPDISGQADNAGIEPPQPALSVEPWLKGNDGVDVARAASGSMKGRAKMVVVETHLKEKLWGERRRSGIIVAG
jgi:hypothetical protein